MMTMRERLERIERLVIQIAPAIIVDSARDWDRTCLASLQAEISAALEACPPALPPQEGDCPLCGAPNHGNEECPQIPF